MKDGLSRIKGHTVMIADGKILWGVDEKGWSVDIFRISDNGEKILANNELTVSKFRKLYNAGKIVFE